MARPLLCDDHASVGGYYLRDEHQSIHRHTETIALHPDHTATWELKIDIELPTDAEAHCAHYTDQCLFLFPLIYLKKSDTRAGFEVRDKDDALIPIPTRHECDRVTGIAFAEAAIASLHSARGPKLDKEQLQKNLRQIPAENPFDAAKKFSALFAILEPDNPEFTPDTKLSKAQCIQGKRIGTILRNSGISEGLRMLVEHTMVWIPLQGIPGERRSIRVSQDIALVRRPVLRWSIGTPDPNRYRWGRKRFERWQDNPEESPVLDTDEKLYGRRGYRISFPALGQRIAQPLAWMPVEYDFPTIYTRRCNSYHFELTCPRGLSPKDVKLGRGDPIEGRADTSSDSGQGRTMLMPHMAHHNREGNRSGIDLWFRVTVGVAAGAFPVLWLLAGGITAILLWILAGIAPDLDPRSNGIEIAAGILLIVPATMAALAIGGDDTPVTQLIAGARIILLVNGLCAVVAAAVLINLRPFHIDQEWMWTACAITATAATVPLATSWILSIPVVWRQLQKLKSAHAQYAILLVGIALAEIAAVGLLILSDARIFDRPPDQVPLLRAIAAIYLLILAIGMTVLATNRTAIEIGKNRRYAAVSLFVAAGTCLILACMELKAAISHPTHAQTFTELAAYILLLISWYAGGALSRSTRRYRQGGDEIHVSPNVGRALIAKERVRELMVLRRLENLQASAAKNSVR